MRKTLIALFVFLMLGGVLYALPGLVQYYFKWNANTETDLAGYKVYWRPVGGAFTDANSKTILVPATTQLLTGIVPNKSEVAVTAYDTSGNESNFSTITFFDKDVSAPAPPAGAVITP